MQPRIVFMGSPEFALPTLGALAGSYPVVGVVTQPDRPAGRGREPASPPVKHLALQLSIPIIQPASLKDPAALEILESWKPDLIVVAAFGQILRLRVLDLPRLGCLNVHASLLPRWRGAAPIQAAILHGDAQTGATIMRMDAGVDTGPLLSQWAIPIADDDTGGSLSRKLARLGAELLLEALPGYIAGTIHPQPQDQGRATYAPMLKKEDGVLDFTDGAGALERRVRAFHPWPGTNLTWEGGPLKVLRARAVPDPTGQPGSRTSQDGLPAVYCADGLLVLEEVQPAGKKAMAGEQFLRGARGWSQAEPP